MGKNWQAEDAARRNLEPVNLWSAMRPALKRREDGGDAFYAKLASGARYSGQEISLKAYDDGWRIDVFSCYASGGISITIPRDVRESPLVSETPMEDYGSPAEDDCPGCDACNPADGEG